MLGCKGLIVQEEASKHRMDGESKQLNRELMESETIKKFRCIMCPFN